jgi:L-lactate dehydrogenase
MKIGIVGCGYVGSTAAYALIMRGIGREIVLVDKNADRANAEADDLFHAVPFAHQLRISPGSYADLTGSRVVIIAAGVNQKPGESRLQLLKRNAAVFEEVIPNILDNAPEAVLVVATNPVDIMTHVAAYFAGLRGIQSNKIIGSGTTLDTARFRTLLGNHVAVDPQHVHSYVIGEHGDSEVLTWSLASIGGIPLKNYCKQNKITLDKTVKQDIDRKVRMAAYHIIAGKGATYYGIGSALARIVEVILKNQRAILTVCSPINEVLGIKNVTLSLPCLINGEGIIDAIFLTLNKSEQKALRRSAQIIKTATDAINI